MDRPDEPATPQVPDVRLTVPARAENVAIVRQALAGLADGLAIDPAVLADMKVAVSEACTNVVVHAYGDGDGTIEVDAAPDNGIVVIVVRDFGTGIRPRLDPEDSEAGGLGLPLIAALAEGFEVQGAEGEGTEVRMTFALQRVP